MTSGWIGVDFDGTLAFYDTWKGPEAEHLGAPIWPMVNRVKTWLNQGIEVRIVTARVASCGAINEQGTHDDAAFADHQRKIIGDWCEKHIGKRLKVTAQKDFLMQDLYDDRAIRVETNTGKLL